MNKHQIVDMNTTLIECDLWTLYKVGALNAETMRRCIGRDIQDGFYTFEFALGVGNRILCQVFQSYYEDDYELTETLYGTLSKSMTEIVKGVL